MKDSSWRDTSNSARSSDCKMAGQLFIILAVATAFAAAYVPPSVPELLEQYSNAAGNAPKACDATMLNTCTQAFFANFGGQIPYSNETIFAYALYGYLNVQGVDGWRNVQIWLNTLTTCLGGKQGYEACYDWNNLMAAWSVNNMTAKQWNVRFLNLEYDCGPGFQIMLRDWYCIQGVAIHEGPVIAQCQANFTAAQNSQPNMVCQHIVDYLVCIEIPYIQHCGRAAGGLVCHGELNAYKIYRPDCVSQVQLQCRGAPPGM